MNKKFKAEMTLEASIVVPIIIIIVLSLIYFAFYIHDVVVVKSSVYSNGVKYINKNIDDFNTQIKKSIEKTTLFVMKPTVECRQDSSSYIIKITLVNKNKVKLWQQLLEGQLVDIKIQKQMNRATMYKIRGILDLVEQY